MSQQQTTLSITELAKALGQSREHVSRNYKAWGFKLVPWSPSPRVLASDVDRFNAGTLKTDALAESGRKARELRQRADLADPYSADD